jgi:hypothetical protein
VTGEALGWGGPGWAEVRHWYGGGSAVSKGQGQHEGRGAWHTPVVTLTLCVGGNVRRRVPSGWAKSAIGLGEELNALKGVGCMGTQVGSTKAARKGEELGALQIPPVCGTKAVRRSLPHLYCKR